MVKTYTPDERAARRRRTSSVKRNGIGSLDPPSRSSVFNALNRVNSGLGADRSGGNENTDVVITGLGGRGVVGAHPSQIEDDEESWIRDLRIQGVDVSEFLNPVHPPEMVTIFPSESSPTDKNGINGSGGDASTSLAQRRSYARHDVPNGDRMTMMRELSLCSTNTETAKQRFTSFLDVAYEIDEATGQAVVSSVEEMHRKRWEKEVLEDSRHFEPNGSVRDEREQNKNRAIQMALKRASEAGLQTTQFSNINGEKVTLENDRTVSNDSDQVRPKKCSPPSTHPLPPLDQLNLDPRPAAPVDPREIRSLPPFLPQSPMSIVPKLSRTHVGGISDGMLVYGSYDEGWALCESDTMVVSCVNSPHKCGCYLRCSREASLVRCPRCNTVSPVGPELVSRRKTLERVKSESSMTSTGAVASYSSGIVERKTPKRRSSLSSAVLTVGWGG